MQALNRRPYDFPGHERREIIIEQNFEALYAAGYKSFGWMLMETAPATGGRAAVVMKFRREQAINNKAELTRLQRQFDAYAGEVIALENSKASIASAAAYALGAIGGICLVAAAALCLGGKGVLALLPAIPGLLAWVLPYACYKKMYRHKMSKVTPVIEKRYGDIRRVCEKAGRLLDWNSRHATIP